MKALTSALSLLGCFIFLAGCSSPEIGLIEGALRPCPDSPNCVSSQGGNQEHAIAPISYSTTREEAYEKIRRILAQEPNVKIIKEEKNYLHAEFRTKFMRFVDDVEFLFPENESLIHVRSASRVGYSDLGVNRKRVEHIRDLFTMKSAIK